MLGLLISILLLCLILAVAWWIILLFPVPPPLDRAVKGIFALICLIALLSLLFGGWSFPMIHPLVR